MTRYLVGIAGYGVVGRRRHTFIDAHPALRTVAVCDQRLAEGTTSDGVRQFADYQRLLQEPLDAVFVCLPNELAPHVTMAALERGVHVFCEKPPGRSLDDIVAVIRCHRKHPHLKLKYGFNHRYHDSIREALRIIHTGELGAVLNLRGVYGKSKIISFDSDWRTKRALAGGGVLLDQGIHMVDMMRLFAGEFSDVYSFVSNTYWHHDVEDNAFALMRTPSGVVATLHSSATQWRHTFHLDISLARGSISLAGILSGSKSYGAETIRVAYASEHDGGDPREVSIRYNHDPSWEREIAEFAEALIEDRPVTSGSAVEALKSMHLVYRIYCADAEWRTRYGLSDQIPDDIRAEAYLQT